MIELKNISVTFQQKNKTIAAVKKVDLQIEKGDVYALWAIRCWKKYLGSGHQPAAKNLLKGGMDKRNAPESAKAKSAATGT